MLHPCRAATQSLCRASVLLGSGQARRAASTVLVEAVQPALMGLFSFCWVNLPQRHCISPQHGTCTAVAVGVASLWHEPICCAVAHVNPAMTCLASVHCTCTSESLLACGLQLCAAQSGRQVATSLRAAHLFLPDSTAAVCAISAHPLADLAQRPRSAAVPPSEQHAAPQHIPLCKDNVLAMAAAPASELRELRDHCAHLQRHIAAMAEQLGKMQVGPQPKRPFAVICKVSENSCRCISQNNFASSL